MKRSQNKRNKAKRTIHLRAISPVIVTILLVALGIALVLMIAGPLRGMVSSNELVIKQQESYIYTIGNSAKLVLSLQNNNGNITITKITVETDNSAIELSSNLTIASRSKKVVEEDLGAASKFGGKDAYKVVVNYAKPDGSTGVAVETIVFKG